MESGLPEMSQETPRCLICGSKRLSTLYEGVRDHFGIAMDEYRFLRCEECHSATLDPLPTSEALTRLYPPVYTFKRAEPNEPLFSRILRSVEWSVFYLPNYRRRLKIFRRLTGLDSGAILEVGCGSGLFLQVLAKAGYAVEGIDISEPAVAYARNRLGLRVFHGALEDLALTENRYDAVVLYAILEHVPNPLVTVKTVLKILKPGGFIVLGVPVIDSWQARLLGSRWCMVREAPRHLIVPSCHGMQWLLTSVGFKNVRSAPAPLLDNAGAFALSLLPAATTSMSYGQPGLFKLILTRCVGGLLVMPAAPIVLAERLFSKIASAGTMMFCAQK